MACLTLLQVRNYHMGFMEIPRSENESPQLVLLCVHVT
jgi:hypothetical protein